MKKFLFALVFLFPLLALAASEIKDTVDGIVKRADCQLIAKDTNTAGAIVGGTAGATAGAVIGKSLFGKGGGIIGGFLGGAAGGAIGNEVGAVETYQCKLIVQTDDTQLLVQTVTNKVPAIGSKVTVVEMVDGTKEIM